MRTQMKKQNKYFKHREREIQSRTFDDRYNAAAEQCMRRVQKKQQQHKKLEKNVFG